MRRNSMRPTSPRREQTREREKDLKYLEARDKGEREETLLGIIKCEEEIELIERNCDT